ncbi:MAG: ribonuclease H-like domain-containing protein [Chloroflexi bacterium]|nr:ribonuclease H-like domain-containing protein [Chloroflexota bacterium]
MSRLFTTVERPAAARRFVRLEDAAPGQLHSAGGGECWLVEQSVEQGAPWAPAAFLRVQAGWSGGTGRRAARRAGCHLEGLHHLLFVDLETTGLSDCPLFLIGTLQWDGGCFVIRQYFARRPAEERHALAGYARIAARFPALVTFNGHRFDEPFLRSRAAFHNVSLPPVYGHLDLLQPARRHLRESLPDCRLQTLEKELCGRRRVGDLPGREIPAAYAAFVRTGDASQVAAILEHNRLDLLTMLDLLDRIPLGP